VTTTLADAALWYVHNGFPVFPVHSVHDGCCSCGKPECEHPGKHPRTSRGFKDATKDPDQARRWWDKWPDANIGIPTGRVSDLLVIDIDPRNAGDDSWETLIREYGSIPDTAEQVTGGGGRHIVFRDAGIPVSKELAPGIDVKPEFRN
jgi:putative DNA primase/helicase